MADDAPVVAAAYSSRPEADLARARLEAEGIRAAVLGDDAGGLYPNLSSGGVKVVVSERDLERSRRILEDLDPGAEATH
jgi:hypothetical protein